MQERETEIEMSAKTVEEAVELALKELDADRSDVEIDVVSRGKAGILGIGSEPARVRVAQLSSPPDSVKTASEVIESLIHYLDVEVTLTLKQAHNEDLLIGRKGETLKTLQFMVRYMVSRKLGDRVNLMVDVEGYQERRHLALRNMARRVADRVSDTGRSISLEPMPPNERRIVHLALSDHPEVTTESDGMGSSRQVVVQLRD